MFPQNSGLPERSGRRPLANREDPTKARRRGQAEEEILARLWQAEGMTTGVKVCRPVESRSRTDREFPLANSNIRLHS